MTYTKICDCGIAVSGRTENILKSNLKKHKDSKSHKRQIQLKKEGGSKR